MKKKRVLVISDLHCGHRVGLTPPQYRSAIPGKRYHQIQVEIYDWFRNKCRELRPIHTLVINGDAVDGTGIRSKGTELITTSIKKQCDMAIECICEVEAKNIVMTYGTPYHTGTGEDAEEIIAEAVGAEIHDHAKYKINGTIFSFKHKIGSSTIPHGKATPIAKERLWDFLWTEWDESEKADVIVRSHVHYSAFTGEPTMWLGMTTPALQGLGSKFGARQCSGVVHVGMNHFDCYKDGSYHWEPHILRAASQKRKVYEL